jgi:hypothetical protein
MVFYTVISPHSQKYALCRTHDGSQHHKRVAFYQALACLRLRWQKDSGRGGTTPRTEDANAEYSGVVVDDGIGGVRSMADMDSNVDKESIEESIAARPGRRAQGPAKRR